MVVAARDHVKSWVVPKFDHRDASLVLYLPLWYQYSDMTGSTIYSYDRNRYSCTVTGATWGRQGRTFAGSDDFITIPDAPSLSFGNATTDSPFSVAIWVKFVDVSADAAVLVSKWDNNASYMTEWIFNISNTRLYFNCFDGTGGTVYIGRQYNFALDGYDNKWMFLVGTYDGSEANSGFKLYIDAARVDDTNVSAGVYVAMHDSSQKVGIFGRFINDVLNIPSNGIAGDVWIYNKVLALAEIQNIRLATKWRYV